MKRKDLILLMLYAIPSMIFSSPKENVHPNEIFVGDKVDYEITFHSSLPNDLSFPEGEMYVETSPDLPSYKILSATKTSNSLRLTIRFYEAGNYSLPITWEDNGSIASAQTIIKVKSQLTGEEKDFEDIEPPISFSGPYLLRLIFFLFLLFLIFYLAYAFYLYRRKSGKIMNATWEEIPFLEERLAKLYLIEGILQSETVHLKDFVYLISSYCKEEYSYRLSHNLLAFTDEEFLAYLYDRSSLTDHKLREIRFFFRESKYTDKNETLTGEEAKRLWTEWKDKLGL
ncbi:LB_053 family protein [Leptospira ilyithenensis]|uniref:Uncharacterized protein n=1 Tax=Leptospira ilyithenensis TaxID=2484901 RepID=A0A4R9LVE6_9LEPT|nr:hypothetical protein [Leptospira ilyithenensis]TGN14560.1 hypothetical protein EHS11_00785 [Leptospira ilyithenensis]